MNYNDFADLIFKSVGFLRNMNLQKSNHNTYKNAINSEIPVNGAILLVNFCFLKQILE